MSIRPEGRKGDAPTKHGIRPRDDGEDDHVEVVLIESDDDETARDDVEVIDVDTDSGGEADGVVATGGSANEGSGTWRHHAPVVGNLQRLPKGNANNVHSARDKLTRALKRQVTAPAWKLIRDLNVDPIEVKDDGAVEGKDDEEKAFHCTECDFRSDCRRRFLSHYELAHVLPDNFSCEFCSFTSPIVEERNCHMERKHLACAECDYRAGDHEEMMRHAARHWWDPMEPSSETAAAAVMTWRTSSDGNNNNNEPGRHFACGQCDYTTTRSSNLTRHAKARHSLKNFMCTLCNFRSAQRWCVKQHIVQVHRKLRLYVCPHCEHRATSRGNLNVHIRKVHFMEREMASRRARYGPGLGLKNEAQSQFKNAVERERSYMQPRQRQGHQPGSFACTMCGYMTSAELDLYRHIKKEHPVVAPDVQDISDTMDSGGDSMPLNVVTLDEAGLESGMISIVHE